MASLRSLQLSPSCCTRDERPRTKGDHLSKPRTRDHEGARCGLRDRRNTVYVFCFSDVGPVTGAALRQSDYFLINFPEPLSSCSTCGFPL